MENSERVFISYSSKNMDTVKKIVEEIEKENIKCYIAPRDITPGSIYAEEIVNAIANSVCCILFFSNESNTSNYVLKEINSATNHDKLVIPVKIDNTIPCKSLDFYLGTNHWISCLNINNDTNNLINAIKKMIHVEIKENDKNIESSLTVKYKGPVVLGYTELEEINYDAERRVIETIEIDYLTLDNGKNDYIINEEIEGSMEDWKEYASDYPETCLGLIVNDKMVGYSQIEMINEDNYNLITSGKQMINAGMEEFYGFGGEFYCYIVIMPIIKKYENSNNYLLLFNTFFNQMIAFSEMGIEIKKYAISVYSTLLETIVKTLNFKFLTINPAGGKIYELDKEGILNCPIFKKRYPAFYKLYGESNE